MSKKYFTNFPLVDYQGTDARNILLKSQFFKQVLNSSSSFYSYVVRDGERPDTIAYDYYGSSDYAWLVYFSNSITDPYFEWPLTDRQFNEYIINKYGSIEQAQRTIVFYTYNGEANTNDLQYEYNLSYKMDTETYNYKTGYIFSGNGTITGTTTSNVIIGTNTAFSTELSSGFVLYNSSNTEIGTVSGVSNSTQLTLTANCALTVSSSTFTYKILPGDTSFQANLWTPKRAYDYELEKNDSLRPIRLLDSQYLTQVNREISNIFKK